MGHHNMVNVWIYEKKLAIFKISNSNNNVLSLGPILGLATCLCITPSVVLINKAFPNNRGLAHGFGMAGSTIGATKT